MMNSFQIKNLLFLIVTLLTTQLYSQIYNTNVEAKIIAEEQNEMLQITATAFNKTEIDQSLRFVLSVIRTNPENPNTSKNDQSGRFVLQPSERQSLSTTTINTNSEDRVILLLLIYDTEDNIIGQDRIVFNDKISDEEIKQRLQKKVEQTIYADDLDTKSKDGVTLRGIVTENTKTKPGRDFYSIFFSDYNLNNINGEKIVSVNEVLALGSNTKIEIFVGDDKVVEFFLRPQKEFLKTMSEASIRRVAQHFERIKSEANSIKRY